MDAFDRFAEKRGNADNFDAAVHGIDVGNGIGGDELFDLRSGKELVLTDLAQQTVGNRSVNLGGTVLFKDLGSSAKGSGGAGHIIGDDADAIFDIADQVAGSNSSGVDAAFGHNGETGTEHIAVVHRHLGAA